MAKSIIIAPADTVTVLGVQFEIYQVNSTPWVRGVAVCNALGIGQSTLRSIIKRHGAEFDSAMTTIMLAQSGGGAQQQRMFSPRGAALVAMLSEAPRAAEFRAAILDVLEGRSTIGAPALPVPIATSPSVEALLAPQAKAALRYARLGLTSGEIGRLLDLKGTATRSLLRRLRAAQLLPVAGVSHHG